MRISKPISQIGIATRLHEVGIASNQNRRGEYVPGPCTHRPSHHGVDCTEVDSLTYEGVHHGVVDDWGEVVTR